MQANELNFYTKLQDIINSMWGLREVVSDSKIVRKILWSLLKRFYPKVIAIEKSRDVDKLRLRNL